MFLIKLKNDIKVGEVVCPAIWKGGWVNHEEGERSPFDF